MTVPELDLATAQTAALAALAHAQSLGLKVTVAVVDSSSFPVYLVRECPELPTVEVAILKARLGWLFGRATIEMASSVGNSLPDGSRLGEAGGGAPIFRDGVIIGGIGVSGAAPEDDDRCALVGVAAITT